MLTNVNDTSCLNAQQGGILSESSNIRTNVNSQTKTNNSEKNENFLVGKQIRNGCDIGNSSTEENMDMCMKGGNKKIQ